MSEKCLDFSRYKPYFLGSFELLANKNCLILIRHQFSTFKILYIIGKVQFQKFTFFKFCMYLISEKCLHFSHYKPYFLRHFELFTKRNCLILIRLQFSTFQNSIHCWESSISEVHFFQILHVFDQRKIPGFLALKTSISMLF